MRFPGRRVRKGIRLSRTAQYGLLSSFIRNVRFGPSRSSLRSPTGPCIPIMMPHLTNTRASGARRICVAAFLAATGCGDGSPQAPSPPSVEAPPAVTAAASPVSAGDGFPPDEAVPASQAANPAAAVDAAGDASTGATLKASAPVVVSPKDREELEGLTVTVVVENATPTFVSDATFDYRFELREGEAQPGVLLGEPVVAEGSGATTQHTFMRELREGTTHRWRARAELAGVGGPWSDWAVFRTPVLKVLDPPELAHPINGETVNKVREPLYVTNGAIRNTVGQVIYEFEVDDDAAFGTPIRTEATRRGGAGAGGRTIGYIRGDLAPFTLYRWRVRARDNVDHGPWSDVETFNTSSLKRLDTPVPARPINGETVGSLRAPLQVTNGAIGNTVGQVVYEFEVDDDSAFASPVSAEAARTGGAEAGGRTVGRIEQDLVAGTLYHWRVRARDDVDNSPWSNVQTFRTAAEEPPPTGGDEIDASTVTYLHRNIADWPITSRVTSVTIRGNGICVYHTGAGRFPTSKLGNPGEEIDIEGNVWVFAEFGTQWYGATWDWMRPGQQCKSETTSSLGPEQIRRSPMDSTWQPQSGDTLCFAVSARARDNVVAGRERTNIACTVVP